MPQSSYPFAAVRVRAMETRMLDGAKFARLTEASEAEAVRLLAEWGYAKGETAEEMIVAQLSETRKTLWEITPDVEATGLFLLPIDAHNLKALLKGRLLGRDAQSVLLPGGLYGEQALIRAVSDKDYRQLPEQLQSAMVKIERHIAGGNADPRVLSALVDAAVFEHIAAVLSRRGDSFVRDYFSAKADFTNVLSVVRARTLKWGRDKLEQMLVPGGAMPFSALSESLDLPADALAKKLGAGANGRAVGQALERFARSPDLVDLERRFDAALIERVKREKDGMFTLGPVVGYLLGREAEAKALRVLFAAKRAGGEPALPALYA